MSRTCLDVGIRSLITYTWRCGSNSLISWKRSWISKEELHLVVLLHFGLNEVILRIFTAGIKSLSLTISFRTSKMISSYSVIMFWTARLKRWLAQPINLHTALRENELLLEQLFTTKDATLTYNFRYNSKRRTKNWNACPRPKHSRLS